MTIIHLNDSVDIVSKPLSDADVEYLKSLLPAPPPPVEEPPPRPVPNVLDWYPTAVRGVLSHKESVGPVQAFYTGEPPFVSLQFVEHPIMGIVQMAMVTKNSAGTAGRAEMQYKDVPRMVRLPNGHFCMTQDYWYETTIQLEELDEVSGHFLQFHDNPGGDKRSPPISLNGDIRGLRLRFEKNDDTGGSDYYSPVIVEDPLNRIFRITFQIRWDTRPSKGFLRVWVDGEEKWTWIGQTCHPTPSTEGLMPYPRWGIYKTQYMYGAGEPGDRTIALHSGLKISTESLL